MAVSNDDTDLFGSPQKKRSQSAVWWLWRQLVQLRKNITWDQTDRLSSRDEKDR